jgi:hypothetical protein
MPEALPPTMSPVAAGEFPVDLKRYDRHGGWVLSTGLYATFAVAVCVIQGREPLLGADHISYILLADQIMAECPTGEYWRELSSVRTLGVMLAYLHGVTGSHVLSMKLVLAAFTVAFLLAAELFFRLFATRWQARLFAILSAFAVSFGISSWGLTDSTALLARTLVTPVMMLAAWIWFRYDGRATRYLAFPLLVAGSLLHLSAFYMVAILFLVELWDYLFLRRLRVDRRVPAFIGALAGSAVLLLLLEVAGPSSKLIGVQVPEIARALGFKMENLDQGLKKGCAALLPPPVSERALPVPLLVPVADAAVPDPELNLLSRGAQEAWRTELSLRPWRNMPLPLVNVANIFSSYALIFLLAIAGIVAAFRHGANRSDKLMLGMLLAVPLVAFGPQTVLWFLRSRTTIHPINIEEVRALGLIMIPSLYFVLRLFQRTVTAGGPAMRPKAALIVVGVLALPLVMKNLPGVAREGILSVMAAAGVINPSSESSIANARAALGLAAEAAPLYYSTRGVRAWLQANSLYHDRILTDRDDMILLRERIVIGPRQVSATTYVPTESLVETFLKTSRAMLARDTARVLELARSYKADYVVVPWQVPGAAYSDGTFSVLRVRPKGPAA